MSKAHQRTMNRTASVVLKVILASATLSIAIKYGGPLLPIPATDLNAWIAVLTPSIVLAALLGWRFSQGA